MRIYICIIGFTLAALIMAACSGKSSSSVGDAVLGRGAQSAAGLGGSGANPPSPPVALSSTPPIDPFELAEWDIVSFVDPRDSCVYEIIEGRVIIALKNPPSLPQVDPNYFDIERDATDPVYSQVTYYYTITTDTDGFQTATTDTDIAAFLQAENLTVYSEWPEVGGLAVVLPPGQTVLDAVQNWPTEYPTLIDTVDPDAILDSCTFPYTAPNDELLEHEWHLQTSSVSYPQCSTNQFSANVFSAWQQNLLGHLGHPDRVVAVLDTGVCSQNTDLQLTSTYYGINTGDKRKATEYKMRSFGGGEPWSWLMERSQAYAGGLGHGTLVTGVISAVPNNDTSGTTHINDIAGIAPACKYLPVAVKAKGRLVDGAFSAKFSMSAKLNALRAVGETKGLPGYRVTSLTGATSAPYYNVEVVNISQRIKGKGNRVGNWHLGYIGRYILIIASAGNDGTESYNVWPACHSEVMAVAAHGQDGYKKPDSNYQPYVEISAPGIDILTTDMKGYTANGYYRGFNEFEGIMDGGTSLASPVVSAAAMLVTSKWPSLWPVMVRSHLKNESGSLPDPNLGHMGHVDVYESLNP